MPQKLYAILQEIDKAQIGGKRNMMMSLGKVHVSACSWAFIAMEINSTYIFRVSLALQMTRLFPDN